MPPRGPNVEFNKFDGGLNTHDPEYQLDVSESPDLDNLVIHDLGFKKRQGDSVFNSSAMVSSATPVTGLGYISFDDGTQFLNAVAGTKFFTSSSLSGTMADATGAVSITAAAANYWTPVNFNNLQIWFGGAPDAPFKYSGSGNAAALGGSPPSAYTAFQANNRVFALGTVANPSRLYWPILSNPEDWTGAGSGNSDVATSDGEALQCGIVTGPDTAILFKNSSTHLMVLTRQPFPIYQLQKGVGIAGRYAWALANGVIYFITPSKRLKATRDGINFEIFPQNIDPILDNINSSYIQNIRGIYYPTQDWIIFLVPYGSSTTLNYAIIWDVRFKCFLRCTTGYKSNVLTLVQNRRLFGGHYNGKIYEKDVSTVFADASETSPGAIDAYWRTPFKNLGQGLDSTVHPLYFTVAADTDASTVLELSYGFDFTSAQKIETFSLVPTGGQWDVALWDQGVWGGNTAVAPRMFVSGRGNLFSMKIRNATASQGFNIQGISVRSRTDKARKLMSVI